MFGMEYEMNITAGNSFTVLWCNDGLYAVFLMKYNKQQFYAIHWYGKIQNCIP